MRIETVHAREILDSRGNPTVEVDLQVSDIGMHGFGRAAVPSGASTGVHEALELRDGDKSRYHGKGVLKAVSNVNEKISNVLRGKIVDSQVEVDKLLLDLDGSNNKSNLGANAILGVSMGFAQAVANMKELPLFKSLAELYPNTELKMPRPMFNIMNGGEHAEWSTDIQEFMVIPLVERPFPDIIRIGSEIFHSLEGLLKDKGMSVNVGNEGGFAPHFSSNKEALDFVMKAIEKAGYKPGEDVAMGLDVAASEFFVENGPGEKDDEYELKTEKRELSVDEWRSLLEKWLAEYPLISLEDTFSQDAWESWSDFLADDGNKLEQVVGDDLLVTNTERIEKAIELKACNALLVKVNQIGSLTETVEAMQMASNARWKNVVSHRSGETEDTFISHLAVASGCGQIKTGAPSRGERTAKYNELLRISELL